MKSCIWRTLLVWIPALLFVLLFARPGRADSERTIALEGVERMFGITPTVGAVGDGRLTAQISEEGTITCLRWPNATYNEHINYQTGTYDPDPAKDAWRKPHFGARDNQGIFAGVVFNRSGTSVTAWFRDAEKTFAYRDEDSNTLVAEYRFSRPTLTIRESTLVVPDASTLVRRYDVLEQDASVMMLDLLVIANPALRNTHRAYDPRDQTREDDAERFATVGLPSRLLLVSALPDQWSDAQRDRLRQDMVWQAWESFVEEEMKTWGAGVYFVQGANSNWASWQVGGDAGSGLGQGEDAWQDGQGGVFSKHNFSTGAATTGLSIPFRSSKSVTWFGTFATSVAEALSQGDALIRRDWSDDALDSIDDFWRDWLSGSRLPTDRDARQFAKRTLISLRTGMDPDSGAIIASTSCQPPYNLDWPRDGAFFQWLLEMNGKQAEAERHARYYLRLHANSASLYGPDGSISMNGYADGVPGGPIDFEIDQVGFLLFTWRQHLAALVQRNDLVAALSFYASIETATTGLAGVLLDCRDETSGLPCPANEDDNPEFTQSLHGAITAWLGLRSAAEIFAAVDPVRAEKYRQRQDELGKAIRLYYVPGGKDEAGIQLGALGWSYWPAQFWRPDDQAVLADSRQRFVSRLRQNLLEDAAGTSYDTKMTIALLTPPLRSSQDRALVQELHDVFLGQVIRQDTLHLGEGTVREDFDGDGTKEWRNITATPHLWAQSLLYLSLLAEEDPTILDQAPLPQGVLAEKPASGVQGCGCTIGGYGNWGDILWFLLTGAVLWGMKRQRRHRFLHANGRAQDC